MLCFAGILGALAVVKGLSGVAIVLGEAGGRFDGNAVRQAFFGGVGIVLLRPVGEPTRFGSSSDELIGGGAVKLMWTRIGCGGAAVLTATSCLAEGPSTSVDAVPVPWELEREPSLVLRGFGAGGPELFVSLVDAAWMSDGSIVLADAGSDRIRRFTADGTHLETLGREGRGLGEFSNLWGVFVSSGDTIWGHDQNRWRIVGFHGGEYRRNLAVPRGHPLGWIGRSLIATGIPALDRGPEPRAPGLHRDPWRIVAHAADGSAADTVVRGLSEELWLSDDRIWGRPILGRNPYVALGSDFLVYGDGASADMWVLDPSGDTLTTIPVGEITGAELDRLAEARRADRLEDVPPERRARSRAVLSSIPLPERISDLAGLRVDAADRIWVRRIHLPADSVARWDVFDRDGSPVARIDVPLRLRVREITEDALLTTDRDALDVSRAVVYPIRLVGGRAGG